LVGDFIQTIENDKPKKYKITNVYRNESEEVYRFKGID
jgi:hypothetical protein